MSLSGQTGHRMASRTGWPVLNDPEQTSLPWRKTKDLHKIAPRRSPPEGMKYPCLFQIVSRYAGLSIANAGKRVLFEQGFRSKRTAGQRHWSAIEKSMLGGT